MISVKQQIHEAVTEQLLEEIAKLTERLGKHQSHIYSHRNYDVIKALHILTKESYSVIKDMPLHPVED